MSQNRMPESVRNVEQRAAGSGFTPKPNGQHQQDTRSPLANVQVHPRKMVARKAPILVNFDARGVTVAGILRSCERIEITIQGKPKKAIQYGIFNEKEGQEYRILGTYDINCKLLWPEDRGRYVEVTYVGENMSVVREGRALREFDVQVSMDNPIHASKPEDSLGITDEDIPF
jgi:hypothetical protein